MPEGVEPRPEGAQPGGPSSGSWSIWSAVLFGAAVLLGSFLLYQTLSRYEFSEVSAVIFAVSPWRLISACAFAAASYICLTGFDWLALRYVGHPLSYRRAALASFTALSLGHNIGFAAVSSGAVRYRFYSRWGLGTFEVAKVILFCGITVGLGLASLGGLAVLLQPRLAAQITGLQPMNVLCLGSACLAAPLAYLAAAAAGLRRLRFRQWSLEMPPLRLALGQILLGTLNFTFVAACLHQALNAISPVPYPAAATVYVIVVDKIGRLTLAVDGRSVSLGASAGVAVARSDKHSVDELLVNAYLALDAAKKSGSSCCLYTPSLRDAIEQRRSLEAELHLALERKEFELFYQPQIRLSDKALVGVEALIRWNHPTHAPRTQAFRVRAEPVAALYDTGRVHHVGSYQELEDELIAFSGCTTMI
jgi:glycosyltransferase 2 family protein